MRATIAYLLIVVLLACPYLCMGGERFTAGEEDEGSTTSRPVTCCSCCDRLPSDSDKDSPHSPRGQRDSDCLCHGAIYESRVDCQQSGADDLLVFWVSTAGFQSAKSFGLSHAVHHAPLSCHFPPLITARDLCALTCALLL